MSGDKKKGDKSASNNPTGSGAEKQENGKDSNSRTAHKQGGGHGGHK